jgi:hypothetical protein
MRSVKVDTGDGQGVVIYTDTEAGRLVLQVRRLVHRAADPLAASFKSAVALDAVQASRVAAELPPGASALAAAQARAAGQAHTGKPGPDAGTDL